MVGDIERTGIFRSVEVDDSEATGLDILLGQPAVDNLVAMRQRVTPSAEDEALLDITLAEVQAGQAECPFTEEEMDATFGKGMWKPLERFIHKQSCGKLRPIGSEKKPRAE